MSVSEMQSCLGRLYIDRAFLRLFELNATEALGEYELTGDEREVILDVDRKSLDDFSRSLRAKKKKNIEAFFPALFSIGDRVTDHHYARFYSLHTFSPEDSNRDTNLRFGHFIVESLVNDTELPSWSSDLARFELYRYWARSLPQAFSELEERRAAEVVNEPITTATRPRIREDVKIGDFQFDVFSIAEKLLTDRESLADDTSSKPCVFVFKSKGQGQTPRVFKVSKDTSTLLDLCSGVTTVESICGYFAGPNGSNDASLQKSILGALEKLRGMDVLGV